MVDAPPKPGYWEDQEDGTKVYVGTGAAGNEIRLPYEMHDHCGFRIVELKEILWAFRVSDVLEDGVITTKEAKRVMERLGEAPTDKEWVKALNQVDPHARGVLDFQRFLKLLANFDRSMLTEEELVNAFKIFDKDQSGSIDAIEMQDLMHKLGFECTPMEGQAIIAEADDDDSGEVSYGEFVQKVLANQ
mmetsp:Transcript_134491/g.287747  ORF Transcript_134491/g.287747 Transcript_134491/m.287747 type:complete len:189 (+) Transcript_134491:65-631(+)